jgi:hypothetical protein
MEYLCARLALRGGLLLNPFVHHCKWLQYSTLSILTPLLYRTSKPEKVPTTKSGQSSVSKASSVSQNTKLQLVQQKRHLEAMQKEERRKAIYEALEAKGIKTTKNKYVDDYINGGSKHTVVQIVEILQKKQITAERGSRDRELHRQQQREKMLLRDFAAVKID